MSLQDSLLRLKTACQRDGLDVSQFLAEPWPIVQAYAELQGLNRDEMAEIYNALIAQLEGKDQPLN